MGEGDDLVRTSCALDEVAVDDVLGAGGAPPGAGGLGGVQVGDGELGSEHPGEFDGRVEVVQRLDADGVEEVVGLAEAVQRVHDQLGLHDRSQSVRVANPGPAGGVLDEVPDLEAGVTVLGAQVLAGRALAAFRHAAQRCDVHFGQGPAGHLRVQRLQKPTHLVLDGDGRPIADADRHREASLVDEAVDLLMEMTLVGRVDVGDGHLVGQAPPGTFLRIVAVQ
ncbi:hypothetical protein AB0P17_14240 [Streptomyces sp. NPDC088124]|uniref:hypothetical protein n=1 Tax=Streptomyces sp. NPDC088124 TaxID=3154654 RepID=UPI00342E1EF3